MRIAFYAPLKSPAHETPSGDRRVAGLLLEALLRAGHSVSVASEFRSLDMAGDAVWQAELRRRGQEAAKHLIRRWSQGGAPERPDLWFTYHVYYKAPDWLGPEVSAALRIPYVIAEPSFAPKRAGGPWNLGHEATRDAIQAADALLAPTRYDLQCLVPLVRAAARLLHLPPFLDAEPFARARRDRAVHRARLAREHGLDERLPWLVVAAMMRPGDKFASYRELAAALELLTDVPWQMLVAGDGSARDAVAAALQAAAPGRIRMLGELGGEALAQTYAAGDLFLWPAVNEAYGMAMLEAQAAGLPVVSSALRGVPDVVCHERTGLLAKAGVPHALAAMARSLLQNPAERAAMSERAAAWVARERSLEAASESLAVLLADCVARKGAR